MNKKHFFTIIILVIFIAGGIWLTTKKQATAPDKSTHSEQSVVDQSVNGFEESEEIVIQEQGTASIETKTEVVSLLINFGEDKIETADIDFKSGLTAFDLTKEGTEKLGLNLKYKDSDYGVLIEAIGDFENGQDGKYWLYYLNNESAPTAADQLELKAGDRVEWKFEKPSF